MSHWKCSAQGEIRDRTPTKVLLPEYIRIHSWVELLLNVQQGPWAPREAWSQAEDQTEGRIAGKTGWRDVLAGLE